MFGGNAYDEMAVPHSKRLREAILFFTTAAFLFSCSGFALLATLLGKERFPQDAARMTLLAFVILSLIAGVSLGLWHANHRRQRGEDFLADVRRRAREMATSPLPDGPMWSGKGEYFVLRRVKTAPIRRDRRQSSTKIIGVKYVRDKSKLVDFKDVLGRGKIEVTRQELKLQGYRDIPLSEITNATAHMDGQYVKVKLGVGEIILAPKQWGFKPQEDGRVLVQAILIAALGRPIQLDDDGDDAMFESSDLDDEEVT